MKSGGFVVTAELNPPKGTDLCPLLAKAEALAGLVDGFNVTDSHTSRMTMAPIAAAPYSALEWEPLSGRLKKLGAVK